jgi:hypothetical protein
VIERLQKHACTISAPLLCAAGPAVAGTLASVTPGAAAAAGRAPSVTVRVAITDSAVTLSRATVPVGAVVFRVQNEGSAPHAFEIARKRTPDLAAHQTARLSVALTRPRFYAYSALSRRGTAMSGWLSAIQPCDNPVKTSVAVTIVFGKITLSRPSLRCGTITFVVTNADTSHGQYHDFNVDLHDLGASGRVVQGPILAPGQTKPMVVRIPLKGNVYYACDLPEHAENGETGFINVR